MGCRQPLSLEWILTKYVNNHKKVRGIEYFWIMFIIFADEKCYIVTEKVYYMIIRRDRYLKQVISKKKNGMIKIVTGIRRCGKSYLLNVLFHQHLLDEGVQERDIIVGT